MSNVLFIQNNTPHTGTLTVPAGEKLELILHLPEASLGDQISVDTKELSLKKETFTIDHTHLPDGANAANIRIESTETLGAGAGGYLKVRGPSPGIPVDLLGEITVAIGPEKIKSPSQALQTETNDSKESKDPVMAAKINRKLKEMENEENWKISHRLKIEQANGLKKIWIVLGGIIEYIGYKFTDIIGRFAVYTVIGLIMVTMFGICSGGFLYIGKSLLFPVAEEKPVPPPSPYTLAPVGDISIKNGEVTSTRKQDVSRSRN